MSRILVTKKIPYLSELPDLLRDIGDVFYGSGIDEASVRSDLSDVSVIVATKDAEITRKVVEGAPALRVIATSTAGYDWVDVEAATDAGICVIANTGAAADTVAAFTVGLVLALTRRIVFGDRALRGGEPYPSVRDRLANKPGTTGIELDQGTVGIVGLGAIGSAVAQRMRALFSVDVLAYDPFADRRATAERGITLVKDLVEMCSRVDVLLIHAALTSETHGLIGAEALSAMKPTAYVVNCSRGAVLDERALIRELERGQLAGAALDVFENEPLPSGSPLLRLDNVITTPHIAGVTTQSDARRATVIAERIAQALAGTKPAGLVNPSAWPAAVAHPERRDS